jgi:hypothetical protein
MTHFLGKKLTSKISFHEKIIIFPDYVQLSAKSVTFQVTVIPQGLAERIPYPLLHFLLPWRSPVSRLQGCGSPALSKH